MNVNLDKYRGKSVCVAVSGGKDSMALLHFLLSHRDEYHIKLTALNCDHRMRGAVSAHDSAFVKNYCHKMGIELFLYVAEDKLSGEGEARKWRLGCFLDAAEKHGADCIATAHHLNDNAETVLFNLVRGSALKGVTGIHDEDISFAAGRQCTLIRPFIACTRAQIEEYIKANDIPYVEDETNFSNDYTRNKLRHSVLPALENAVPGASAAIYRFSRIAAEDEEYLARQAKKLIFRRKDCYIIECNPERPLFCRAAAIVVSSQYAYKRKDYTSHQLERLYDLSRTENGKQFKFLGLTAKKENGYVSISDDAHSEADRAASENAEIPYSEYSQSYSCFSGSIALICESEELLAEELEKLKENYAKTRESDVNNNKLCNENFSDHKIHVLMFDGDKIPSSSVVRLYRNGDRFTKFGGGTKSLGDYFTDKKIPESVRGTIPLICDGKDVLLVFGVEISDRIRVDKNTKNKMFAVGENY